MSRSDCGFICIFFLSILFAKLLLSAFPLPDQINRSPSPEVVWKVVLIEPTNIDLADNDVIDPL